MPCVSSEVSCWKILGDFLWLSCNYYLILTIRKFCNSKEKLKTYSFEGIKKVGHHPSQANKKLWPNLVCKQRVYPTPIENILWRKQDTLVFKTCIEPNTLFCFNCISNNNLMFTIKTKFYLFILNLRPKSFYNKILDFNKV